MPRGTLTSRCRGILKSACFLLVWAGLSGSLGVPVVAADDAAADDTAADDTTWFDRQTQWNGYAQFHFKVADRAAYIVAPKDAAAGKPWIWRARFPGYHAEMDVTLLSKGYHIGFVNVAGMFGSPRAVAIGDAFYNELTTQHGFSPRPVMEGVSRGGLFVYNWVAKNPDKVTCIYCDTPVCDFKSWPGGRGTGLGSPPTWKQCLKAYGFNERQALSFSGNPVDHAEVIAKAKIPILHIVSETDRVVPPKENTYLLKSRLDQHGHAMDIISVPKGTEQSNGHHFDHPAPHRVVDFIVNCDGSRETAQRATDRMQLLRRSKRILFLGDSITYAGHYVVFFDAWLASRAWPVSRDSEAHPIVIDAGLPSETVSGLSEQGHAGGRFPRPDLAERLDRVLKVTKPDLVFACYGINCGIYQPFSDERFGRYQQGIEALKKRVEATGATLVLITPPVYDDQRAKKSFSYNGVLDRYAQWLLAQRSKGWLVVDLHGPMADELKRCRELDHGFTFQPDAVHPNSAGHWFMARQLIRWFSDQDAAKAESPQHMLADRKMPKTALRAIRDRLQLRRDAYLSAAGHKRPGIKAGLPIDEAEQKAEQITARLAD